jgi:hypothetical protein
MAMTSSAEFTAPERPGKAQAEQRAIPLADHVVRAERDHLADQIRGRRRLTLLGRADGAADPAQHCLHSLAAGRRLMPRHLVVVADRGGPAADGAGLAAAVGQAGEVGGDDAHVRWQGCGAPQSAPGGEVAEVRRVGRPGSQRLLCLGVGHGGVDLGGGERAGQRQVERDQGVQGGSPAVRAASAMGLGRRVIRRTIAV